MSNYEKSGRVFIAYKGNEYDESELVRKLRSTFVSSYTVKTLNRSDSDVIFAKVVYDNYVSDRDPYWNSQTKIGTVSGYDQDEISSANSDYYRYGIDDSDKYHVLINKLYKDYDLDVFKKLANCGMHFSSVIWDESSNSLIAGVTESTDKYTNLYY